MKYKLKESLQLFVDHLRIRKRMLLQSRRATFKEVIELPPKKGRMYTNNLLLTDPINRIEASVYEELIPTSNVPLFLQKDRKWAEIPYGTDGNKAIGANGCAIVTLAMVANHYGLNYTPADVQKWAKNDYYIYVLGTSWNIFKDFGQSHGLECINLGTNLEQAKEALVQQHLVITSLKEGRFTNEGHMVVLTDYRNGKFSMNDPNDDEKKLHGFQWFESEEVAESSLNFWAMYPKKRTA